MLVIKPTALGDVAQALTVAPVLKSRGGRLTWLVDEDYAPLVTACPWVDELITFPRRRLRAAPAAFARWLLTLRRHKFDLALDLQGLARSALMTRAVRATRRVGLQSGREWSRLAYDEVVADVQTHAADRYLTAALTVTGTASGDAMTDTQLLVRPPDELPAGLRTGGYTVLHPYSRWETKLWPWRNYEQLARLLPEEKFVLVGQGNFFPATAPNLLDLRGQTDLRGLLTLLGAARAVVGTDSGPLHVAAALDRPLVALFGATDPRKTAPRARQVKLLTTDLSCRPCLRRHCQRANRMACLRAITPAQVVAAWRSLVD
ncbi:MAG: glycosyltransferase family 9 protein [Verrucomicrobiales bacterium]|jgi:ADP-heptose:LPS heptosyltransferase|nr:glycosyltransferase family 9 protein [Verrucomicrobiales bacterium]